MTTYVVIAVLLLAAFLRYGVLPAYRNHKLLTEPPKRAVSAVRLPVGQEGSEQSMLYFFRSVAGQDGPLSSSREAQRSGDGCLQIAYHVVGQAKGQSKQDTIIRFDPKHGDQIKADLRGAYDNKVRFYRVDEDPIARLHEACYPTIPEPDQSA